MQTFQRYAVRTDCDYELVLPRLQDVRIARLLHVAMGLCTEAAEFLDQLKRVIYYGKALDTVNLLEELGDTSWYARLGCDELEANLLHVMENNVAKLQARYPDKFSEHAAENRDLARERAVLEGPHGLSSADLPLPGADKVVPLTDNLIGQLDEALAKGKSLYCCFPVGGTTCGYHKEQHSDNGGTIDHTFRCGVCADSPTPGWRKDAGHHGEPCVCNPAGER